MIAPKDRSKPPGFRSILSFAQIETVFHESEFLDSDKNVVLFFFLFSLLFGYLFLFYEVC